MVRNLNTQGKVLINNLNLGSSKYSTLPAGGVPLKEIFAGRLSADHARVRQSTTTELAQQSTTEIRGCREAIREIFCVASDAKDG